MRRLLLISYYFPPCGGAGVQRWLRILKYLPLEGWDITVLTTKSGDYPIIDDTLLEELPPEIKVVRTKTPIFGNVYKKISGEKSKIPYGSLNSSKSDSFLKRVLFWIRINLVIPDARVIWNRHAYTKAVELLRESPYDIVLTTAPPHSTHLIGAKLKKNFPNITWVTDFRDPWSEIFYLKLAKQMKFALLINKYLERKIIAKADLNIVVSDFISECLPQGNKITINNSFDPAKFDLSTFNSSTKYRIKYIGKITEGQDFETFLKGLELSNLKPNKVELSLIGTFEQQPAYDCSHNINLINYLPHAEATKEMINAELLILLINDYPQNRGMLTTKLFEYLGANTPILCIGPKNGNAASIISQCSAGEIFDYGDNSSIANYLDISYQKWEDNKNFRTTNNSFYSVKEQIKNINQILGKLLDK